MSLKAIVKSILLIITSPCNYIQRFGHNHFLLLKDAKYITLTPMNSLKLWKNGNITVNYSDDFGRMTSMNLDRKIRALDARIGVIGLGYVGLPLALTATQAGFSPA